MVAREEGQGVPAAERVVTGPDGLASVDVEMPSSPDLTRIVFRMEDDAGSYLPFDIVSAPVFDADLVPGQIVARLDVPKGGAILRFRLDGDADVILVPYETDPDRSGAAYRILYQGSTPGPAAAAFGAAPPRFPQALAPRGEAGDVIEGAAGERRVLRTAAVPQRLDIASCMVSVSRKAPLRYLGTRIALYVDTPPGAHQARIDSIGRAFDERIFPRNTELFGATSDVDGNGVVFVVMTHELRDVDGVYCDSIRRVGTEALVVGWDADRPLDRVLATLTHEHQHLVNAGHHVRVRRQRGRRALDQRGPVARRRGAARLLARVADPPVGVPEWAERWPVDAAPRLRAGVRQPIHGVLPLYRGPLRPGRAAKTHARAAGGGSTTWSS